MTTPKEPNFFSDDPVFAKGFEWYASLFDAAAPGDLATLLAGNDTWTIPA